MKTLFPAVLLATSLALGGCTSLSPQLDAQFGYSVMTARSQQTIDPEAVNKTALANGIDGQAGHSAYSRYQESFRSPPPQPSLLSIGLAPSGGGK